MLTDATPVRGGQFLVRHELASAALARRRLCDELAWLHLSRTVIDDAALIASELITNAILHTESTDMLAVYWELTTTGVVVSVEDHSTHTPVVGQTDAAATGGRGLPIIDALSLDWGVRPHRSGKQVWALIAV